ncbi:hypothetical protein [Streptomyces sp. STCH 565 A]|uniref:hypothetical protein n=1 Tax=Streptomyces sp. STCH 565 A TaxID=2950532 RepID=UPI002075C93F|nr:hypothetical protein [Streptomyces sp. STCH 565 A]MCM8548811.1 hypothetical protein [Streptomyces sp. STCH 565 A]
MKIQIVACDIDKETPAKSYAITVDGEEHELDLCQEHARPIDELIAAAKGETLPEPAKAQAAPPMQFTPPSPAPRKTAASAEQKPAAKKRGGRRPKITSMEEIEAAKARKAQD